MSPALAGRFFTTEPPGKPLFLLFFPCHAAFGISVPQPGIELLPGVLTAGASGSPLVNHSYHMIWSAVAFIDGNGAIR